MSNNLKAAVLIGLSIAMSGVCDANAATISENDTLPFSADGSDPTQIPIGTPIALLFLGAALLFIPTIEQLELTTVFGTTGQTGSTLGEPEFPAGTLVFSSPMPLSAATLQAFLSGGTTVAQLENDNPDLTPVGGTPLPATLALFATGLGALGLLGWRKRRKAGAGLLGAA